MARGTRRCRRTRSGAGPRGVVSCKLRFLVTLLGKCCNFCDFSFPVVFVFVSLPFSCSSKKNCLVHSVCITRTCIENFATLICKRRTCFTPLRPSFSIHYLCVFVFSYFFCFLYFEFEIRFFFFTFTYDLNNEKNMRNIDDFLYIFCITMANAASLRASVVLYMSCVEDCFYYYFCALIRFNNERYTCTQEANKINRALTH